MPRETFMYVPGSTLGMSASISVNRRLISGGGNAQALLEEAMTQAREVASQLPRLRARLDAYAETEYASAPEQSFEFGLQAVLDGLGQRLSAHPLHR